MDFSLFVSGFCMGICVAALFQKEYSTALIDFMFAFLNFALYLNT